MTGAAAAKSRRAPDRRAFLLGGMLAGAAALPSIFTPRRRDHLIGAHSLEELIPSRIGTWSQVPGNTKSLRS